MARVPITVSTRFARDIKGKESARYQKMISETFEDLFENPDGAVDFRSKHAENLFSLSLKDSQRIVLLKTEDNRFIPVFFGGHEDYERFMDFNPPQSTDDITETVMELDIHDNLANKVETLNDLSLIGKIPRPTEEELQQAQDDVIINQILNPGDVVENESLGFMADPEGKTAYLYCMYRNAVVIIDADDGMSLVQFDDIDQGFNFFATLEETAREEFEREGIAFVEPCEGGLDATVMAYNMTHNTVGRVTKYTSPNVQKASHNLSGTFQRVSMPAPEPRPEPGQDRKVA